MTAVWWQEALAFYQQFEVILCVGAPSPVAMFGYKDGPVRLVQPDTQVPCSTHTLQLLSFVLQQVFCVDFSADFAGVLEHLGDGLDGPPTADLAPPVLPVVPCHAGRCFAELRVCSAASRRQGPTDAAKDVPRSREFAAGTRNCC